MTYAPTTTRAVNLPDETWAKLEQVVIRSNGQPDNVLNRLINEGLKAYAERWPKVYGDLGGQP